jgi:hypothetical protein
MTSWGRIALWAAAGEVALGKINMLRPRISHKDIEARIRE